MSELHRDVSQERSDQERVTPLLVVDERLSEIARCEFDMAALGDLMRRYGIRDDKIKATTVNILDITPDLRAEYEESKVFDGAIPFGWCDRSTYEANVYVFEIFRQRRGDPNAELYGMTDSDALAWLEMNLNDTIVHEIGHAIYYDRADRVSDKAWTAQSGLLGATALGLVGMGIGRLLGLKGSDVLNSSSARLLSQLGKRTAITASIGIGAFAGYIGVDYADNAAQGRWTKYGNWRYEYTHMDEKFARWLEKRYRDYKFLTLTPLEAVDH